MTTFYYGSVVAKGYKRGPCSVCGKTAERQKAFTQTVNPFNRNADGTVKTSQEIRHEVNAEALAWQNEGDVKHARCEGVRDA